MNNTINHVINQSKIVDLKVLEGFVYIDARLENFVQTNYLEIPYKLNIGTNNKKIIKEGTVRYIIGELKSTTKQIEICPCCGAKIHCGGTVVTTLLHIPMGNSFTKIKVKRNRFRCSNRKCNYTELEHIEFKNDKHLITNELYRYIVNEMSLGKTIKEVATATGVHRNIIKEIDLLNLLNRYTYINEKGNLSFTKPDVQATILGIDEFKLHDGHKYATIIVDMATGYILWVQEGKKKQVVYDFIDHVGLDYMSKVSAISADMNSNYAEAFKERCPHLDLVYDHFHIVKNFNDKVISRIRIDEYKRLLAEGLDKVAKKLKKVKYILMSSKETLIEKDIEADNYNNDLNEQTDGLLKKRALPKANDNFARYMDLIKNNKLFLVCDTIKEELKYAYKSRCKIQMLDSISTIIKICKGTGNTRLLWFARLLSNHIEGIITHAIYKVTNGKIEGINQRIKTLRRKCYGLPNDLYFFLKLMHESRKTAQGHFDPTIF